MTILGREKISVILAVTSPAVIVPVFMLLAVNGIDSVLLMLFITKNGLVFPRLAESCSK